MSIPRYAFTGLFACVLAAAAPLSHAVARADSKDIKLTGCLVRGEGDRSGYLLTNTPAEPAWQHSADANVAPSAVGTTGTYATIFYWLDGDRSTVVAMVATDAVGNSGLLGMALVDDHTAVVHYTRPTQTYVKPSAFMRCGS